MTINAPTSVVDNINNFNGNKNSATVKAQTNYQDFLKLLTTQLQNQDPTAPADTTQLTQQIATLSQVEQQINTNSNLQKLIDIFSAGYINNMVSYIGKQVETDGDKGVLQNGKASFVYSLEKAATSVTVQIYDAAGKMVVSADGTKLAGRNEVLWNGKDSKGKQLADGTYTMKVIAKDASGDDMKVTTSTTGVVTSVDSNAGTTALSLGDVSVAIDKVKSVRQAI